MVPLSQQIEARLRAAAAAALGEAYAEADPLLTPATDSKFGDYQANLAMGLAKGVGQKPRDIARRIVDHLDGDGLFARVEVAGPGFINLTIAPAALAQAAAAMFADARLGVVPADPPDHVVVDYSSPNVAKEMHVGHLRSTAIGDALGRVLEALGHRVTRQNHLGDWGTQFGMLIEHLTDLGWTPASPQETHADTRIGDLNQLYKDAKKRFDDDADFARRSRRRVVRLQSGDAATLSLWQLLVDESRRHFNAIYQALGVKLIDDDLAPESTYNPALPGVIQRLEKAGVLQESQGAAVVFPDPRKFKDREGRPLPMIVRKSGANAQGPSGDTSGDTSGGGGGGGGYLYATTDLAAAIHRLEEMGADRVIYVVDARQSQHFEMLFATLRQAAIADARTRLDHVPFGTVLGQDRRPFKTRSGETVKLADLLEQAVDRAADVLADKSPDLPQDQRREIARTVGIGALKYADLSNDRVKDYVFDLDRMLALDGNTAPYLQNAYVRIRSIFRKGRVAPEDAAGFDIHIADDAEKALVLKLIQLPGVIAAVGESLEPHRLCSYLYELASQYHQFYERCPVLKSQDDPTRESRLALSALTARTLQFGLDLLGIGVVERM